MTHVTIFCINSHPSSFIHSFNKNVLNSYYVPNIIPTIRDTNGEKNQKKFPCFYGAFQLEGRDVKPNNHSNKCTTALNQKEIQIYESVKQGKLT